MCAFCMHGFARFGEGKRLADGVFVRIVGGDEGGGGAQFAVHRGSGDRYS